MRYQSYYKLIDLFVWNRETEKPYADVLIQPTNETGRLMETLNLHARYTDAGVSIFYRRQREQLPEGNWSEEVSFDHQVLYFTFETTNGSLLGNLFNSISEPVSPQKWVYHFSAKGPERIYVQPPVFTQLFADSAGYREFRIYSGGYMIPAGARYSDKVKSDDEGKYSCSADLTGLPAGFYDLFLEEMAGFKAYIDTGRDLTGKTGLLSFPLVSYSYGSNPAGNTQNIYFSI